MAEPVPWPVAWQEALYGPRGAYRTPTGPAAHFTTATHGPTGPLLARALARLADREGRSHVVDVGAGRGELLAAVHAVRPGLALTGVDVVARPAGLPAAAHWLTSPGGADLPPGLDGLQDALVVAHEWLDVVPCTVAEVDAHGRLRGVLVDPATGRESLGDPLGPDELAWCAEHWPATAPGARVEVGLARDRAWAGLLGRVTRGTVLAVDYGHTRATRPAEGSLAGYRRGEQVPPVPDGTCDVTAHVAVDSLEQDERHGQRTVLLDLLGDVRAPSVERAHTDPAGYLAGLARSSALHALVAPGGFGDFSWVIARRPARRGGGPPAPGGGAAD
ncbi:SAM-dependent methyltransferase [Phycicoccus endophyticus]|uniref:SAM-dependent methyltransferase n=1 Tax=Phycicoccus endophyticus TaxID=1690220 RepID=A0A7G9QZM3_9MICO|nr:SAM-dependent methyltransferase [Phycicoccus endophyticus]NHI19986.1 hypothetical protein [Phycicoccus endophyticus]QNN48798.1 SAM-dependent methyltransferase [Phycicoccus endophyticus]GGL42827.1 hypothetical protein GCM10012283_26790 [Phycicoccus endophyticus]